MRMRLHAPPRRLRFLFSVVRRRQTAAFCSLVVARPAVLPSAPRAETVRVRRTQLFHATS